MIKKFFRWFLGHHKRYCPDCKQHTWQKEVLWFGWVCTECNYPVEFEERLH